MTILIVGIDVAVTYWFSNFYDAIAAYSKQRIVKLLGVFCILVTVNIVFAVYRYYFTQMFSLKWRQWLTENFVARWLGHRNYYYLENFDEHVDNPDQRIQEDVGSLVSYTLELTTGFITATTTFIAFIYVLWQLSGTLKFTIGSGTIYIHGYLVWVSVFYSMIGTYFAFKIGKPLIALNFEQQRREASFRFAAIDLRSHAENVALYRGEDDQKSILSQLFKGVIENWRAIILRQKLLLWFTAGYNQLAVLLPLLVALPNYFARIFGLGGLMQSMRAFNSIQEATSFFVNSYNTIALWRAVGARLTTFSDHMVDIQSRVQKANRLIIHEGDSSLIKAEKVTIYTPRGELLLKNIEETFKHGESYVIKGPSGVGKSTFIRMLAGIWPFVEGTLTYPQHQKMMFLPQKPYMPIGTLADAILFPAKEDKAHAEEMPSVLHECHLDHFIPRLKEVSRWSEQFSPGELQRVAFARILLVKPDWAFLDETTSMLDLANEDYLYRLLITRLPHCSLVSVGHHPSIDEFHQHIVDISRYAD